MPKFLTPEVAEAAVTMVTNGVFLSDAMKERSKRQMLHIVVLAPSVVDAREEDYPEWPDYPIKPALLFEKSIGDKEAWPFPFDNIARCKAQQLWRGQNSDGNTDSVPHLLFADDTPFWGGVKRHGLVVASSGTQAYFDQMISGMVADALKAFGRHAFEESDDKKNGNIFLS
jgi:hypothetical protein